MSRPSTHNVVATYGSPEQAREALESLGRAGFDADRVSLVGQEAEAAASDADTRLRDLEVTAEVGKKAATGGMVGTVLGALAGAAAFAIPGIGAGIGTGIFAAMAAGGIGGGAVGGMVAGIGSMDLSESWELTFQEAIRGGKALVAVHAESDDEVKQAVDVLENEKPEKIEHLDADGNALPEG
ncbi:MAG: hypothetical protein QOE93_1483 [Actinomycetota bacterium]|jgi:uncharacterized protein YcfJ|nr:hypothetical protein [Actinomycetota bacterium]